MNRISEEHQQSVLHIYIYRPYIRIRIHLEKSGRMSLGTLSHLDDKLTRVI